MITSAATPSSSWYAAVLVIRSRVGAFDAEPLLEHQVRLLSASDPEAAYTRALALGEMEGHTYLNSDGVTVTWEFVGLHDLVALDAAPGDGSEVYSWLVRANPDGVVVSKDRLTVFWAAANKHCTADELLDLD